jgi:hypothetical protein
MLAVMQIILSSQRSKELSPLMKGTLSILKALKLVFLTVQTNHRHHHQCQ